MKRVDINLLEETEDRFYSTLNEVPFTGVAFDQLPDGRLVGEITYKDGMMHGRSQDWLPSGQLIEETYYKYNVRHGASREWYPNGKKKKYEYFIRGTLIRNLAWDEQGQLTEDFKLDETFPEYARVCKKLAEEPEESNDIWAGIDDNMDPPRPEEG